MPEKQAYRLELGLGNLCQRSSAQCQLADWCRIRSVCNRQHRFFKLPRPSAKLRRMKITTALLLSLFSLPAFSQPNCSNVASNAARFEFAKVIAPLSPNVGVDYTIVRRSGDQIYFLIGVGAVDPSCRGCYYADYYEVRVLAKTCRLLSVAPRR